jgi:hypothetical protein
MGFPGFNALLHEASRIQSVASWSFQESMCCFMKIPGFNALLDEDSRSQSVAS